MKKILKLTLLSFLVIIGVFILTGCGNKDDSKAIFEVKQVSNKSINVKLENAKKGDEKEAQLVIAEGESINIKTKMESFPGITVYYFKKNSKHDKTAADFEYLNGEGESTTENFPAGEYDVLFEITDANATGNIEINIK